MEISYDKEGGKFKATIAPTTTVGKITFYTIIFLGIVYLVKLIIK